MDFIPFDSVADIGWTYPVAAAAVILFVIALATKLNLVGQIALMLACIGLISVMGTLLTVDIIDRNRAGDWKQSVIAEVEDTYGLKLTVEELAKLEWPSEKPKGDYQSYGTIERTLPEGDSFTRRELTLIWSEDELILAESVDSDEFTELKSR